MPRVSVITPTFNCAQFLDRAIQSVFVQTYSDYEIIVVDDGSTDDTQDVVAKWHDRVTYLHQSNSGPPTARNLGVSRSNGEFLAYLDADDMWYPRRLERQVAFMDAHPECGIVHSDLAMVDEDDKVMFHNWYRDRGFSPSRGFCLMELLCNCCIQVPTVLERRTCFEEAGGFDERFRRVEDYLHWVRVVMGGHAVGFVDEPLAVWRWRGGSLSKNNAAMAEATLQMFHVLIEENGLIERFGPEAERSVQRRVEDLKHGLPFHYRDQGRNDLARKKAVELIRESPGRIYPYVELLKSCIPQPLARALRGA